MASIFIVRHGQDEDNANGILNGRRDRPLTELGRQQAQQLATKLAGYTINTIYASPLQRAYETAAIISRARNVDLVIHGNLVERHFGILTGKPVADIPKYSKKTFQGDRILYFVEAEGAEDFPTLYKRAGRVLKQIVERHPGQNILIVAHGDIGKMMFASWHNMSWQEALSRPYMDNTGVLELQLNGDLFN